MALAERFGLQGEMGMQDVLGQINSRTGGLASSYAATAAQQQYNQYMSQLEEVARQMYGAERSDALQKAQLAYQFSQANYQKYLDQLAQYNADRSFGFDVFDKILQDSHYNQQWQNTLKQQAYQQKRDEVRRSCQEKTLTCCGQRMTKVDEVSLVSRMGFVQDYTDTLLMFRCGCCGQVKFFDASFLEYAPSEEETTLPPQAPEPEPERVTFKPGKKPPWER